MQEKQVYEYAVIRLFPKIERGECMNMGVILFSKRKRYLGMMYHINEERLQAFAGEIDSQEVGDHLKGWQQITDGSQDGGEIAKLGQAERFRWLTAVKSTILQCSRVHPGRCSQPEAELQRLFEHYVV